MAKLCNLIKLLLLLLLVSAAPPAVDTRPARATPSSDLIAGNEFLKLFLERDEQRRDLRSVEQQTLGDGGGGDDAEVVGGGRGSALSGRVGGGSPRSLDYHSRNANVNAHPIVGDDGKEQVVKLVTSGSKIVFLEEYDDDDAVVDAVAREIDLQREPIGAAKSKSVKVTSATARPTTTTTKSPAQHHKSPLASASSHSDEVKVVAVSVSSSKRASSTQQRQQQQREKSQYKIALSTTTTTTTPPPTTTTRSTPTMQPTSSSVGGGGLGGGLGGGGGDGVGAATTSGTDFINRSHKSEFSIEEIEPLTMSQQRKRGKVTPPSGGTLDVLSDSAQSASTNVQNILAAPVTAAATASSAEKNANNQTAIETAEKLLPFQTVIYHDTKEGHGPQSRSISYSSISQNVEDLHSWRNSQSILAEAQRNVSESLVPMPPRSTAPHTSEPAKFYSVPAKMYGVPSKFYSEPAKVYSEPAKVYGQPEKFYSEPAKVYGQPSKFYSEPAKVYSQPSKVYSEPAKNYWPQSALTTSTSTTSTTTTTTTTTTKAPTTTTRRVPLPSTLSPFQARRPGALGTRVTYGGGTGVNGGNGGVSGGGGSNGGSGGDATANTRGHSSSASNVDSGSYHHHSHQHQHNHNHYHNHQTQHHQQQPRPYPQTAFHTQQANTPARPRPLFNLDKLPYDLLNAPEPPLAPATVNFDSERLRPQQPCYDGTQQQQQQQQQQQHFRRQYSSSAVQHSNQNAKGLPNGDLVKCVAKYPANTATATSSSALSQAHFTTERSRSAEADLYTPTPEQNYEIEESVSVMTNGRAHGVQGGAATGGGGSGGGGATTPPTTHTTTAAATVMRQQQHQQQSSRSRIHFGLGIGLPAAPSAYDGNGGGSGGNNNNGHTNANANVGGGADDSVDEPYDVHNNNNNHNNNNHQQQQQQHHYNYEDDYETHGDIAAGNIKNNNNNNNNRNNNGDGVGDDDGVGEGDGEGEGDDDDSKVAYVVEGRNYRKYRVEEKTDDGFIVGEYGVVDHNDGNLRGVRYTADSTVNHSLIQKALLTFLKLK